LAGMFNKNRTFFKNISPRRTRRTRREIRQDNKINRDYVFTSLVFLAKPAFKASFVAGYCLRPQGHRNDLFNKLAKMMFFRHKKAQNVQKLT
jgi:hypothetical protein